MNVALQRSIGERLTAALALVATTVTAGGGADDVAQNGVAIDRFASNRIPQSGKLCVPVEATLGGSETATVALKLQDSADGSTGWADYDYTTDTDQYSPTVINATGNSMVTRNVNLAGAKRWVRAVVTVTMSAASADTAAISATLVLGGWSELPQ